MSLWNIYTFDLAALEPLQPLLHAIQPLREDFLHIRV